MEKKDGTIIGMDVHIGKTHYVALGDEGREVIGADWFTTSATNFIRAVSNFQRPRVVIIEQGPLSNWIERVLSRHVDRVVVAETRRNCWIAKDPNKDDDIDAEKLARLYVGGFIKPIVSQSREKEETISLVIHYFSLIKAYVRIKNQIGAKFRQVGKRKRGEREFNDGEIQRDLIYFQHNQSLERSVKDYHEQLRLLRKQIGRIVAKMQGIASRCEEVKVLRSFPGIGFVGSITLSAFIDTPERFATVKKLWIYCGYGLDRQRSGSHPGIPRITQRCNRYVKYVIMTAVHSIIQRCKNGPYKEWYLYQLSIGKDPRKLRARLARKLIKDIWITWRKVNQQHLQQAA